MGPLSVLQPPGFHAKLPIVGFVLVLWLFGSEPVLWRALSSKMHLGRPSILGTSAGSEDRDVGK